MYFMSIKHCKELLIIVRNDLILSGYDMSPADTDENGETLGLFLVTTARLSVGERKHRARG